MREGRAQTIGRDALAAASSLWLIPLACLLAGAALSFATTAIDSANGFDLLPRSLTGSPEGATQILATIAQSTVQLAGLVLSLSLVVIQLAMGQFSPESSARCSTTAAASGRSASSSAPSPSRSSRSAGSAKAARCPG